MTDNFYIFMAVSFFEWFAMVFFMITFFRIPFKSHIPQVVTLSFAMSLISYVLRGIGLADYIVTIQMLIYVIFVFIIFRIHYFYAIFVGMVGYHGYMVCEVMTYWVLSYTGVGEASDVKPFNYLYFIILFSSILLPLLVSAIMKKMQFGFTFVPNNEHKGVSFKDKNNVILLIVAGLDLYFGNVSYRLIVSNHTDLFFIITLTQLIVMAYFLHHSIQNEIKRHEEKYGLKPF